MTIRNRFNRPVAADRVQHTITRTRELADKLRDANTAVSDQLYKATHVMVLLWKEVCMHDDVHETCLDKLERAEAWLAKSITNGTVTNGEVLQEIQHLRKHIVKPPIDFSTFAERDKDAPQRRWSDTVIQIVSP